MISLVDFGELSQTLFICNICLLRLLRLSSLLLLLRQTIDFRALTTETQLRQLNLHHRPISVGLFLAC
jgi:hypothetical protein